MIPTGLTLAALAAQLAAADGPARIADAWLHGPPAKVRHTKPHDAPRAKRIAKKRAQRAARKATRKAAR